MLKNKHTLRKPDPLTLLIVLVTLGVLMTSAVDAAETFFIPPRLTDLQDGDITIARVGRHGAGLHVSFQSPATLPEGSPVSMPETRQTDSTPNVYLSVHLPW